MPATLAQTNDLLPSWETIEANGTIVVDISKIAGIDASGATDATTLIDEANAAALSALPNASIIDRFGAPSDTYDIQGEVTLYNDMTIDGGGATIITNPKADWQTSVGQFVNQDANQSPGETPPNSPVNTNISIRGLVFYYPKPVWNVPIWIQNATNVDVQDDVFMAASNGQQFYINVKNGIVANVVSIGNINGALNGWNGLENIAITGTYVSNAGSGAGSGGSWFNATSNPNGILGGAQTNNYAVGNVTQGVLPGGDAMALGPLGTGVTASAVDIFGSTDAIGGTPSTFGYIQTNTQNSYQVYNIATGYVAGNPEETNLFNMSSTGTASGFPVSSNDVMAGNLAVGSTRMFQDFQATGTDITLLDNALINGQSGYPQEYQPLVGPVGGLTATVVGQTGELAGSPLIGGPVATGLTLQGPLQEFDPTAGIIPLTGTTLTETGAITSEPITVTVSDLFGNITSNQLTAKTLSYTGNITSVNTFLHSLSFSPGKGAWDDEVHFEARSPGQISSIWDIPITVGQNTITGASAATYSLSDSSFPYNPSIGNGITLMGGDTFTSLGGETLVGSFDPISATLAGDIHTAVVGSGGGTIVGSAIGQDGVIAGTGLIDAILTRGGNDTITAGMAGATVNAATGNDFIQSNEGFINATLGAGQCTVVLGLAGGDIIGGTGFDTIINLPDNAGPVAVTLGSGGGEVYLLSGNNTVVTTESANSILNLGIGSTTISSHGNDTIHSGAGIVALTVARGAHDVLMENVGTVSIRGAGGDLYIDPLFSTQAVANSSSLAVAGSAVPAETFVAQVSGLAGSFGAVGGAIITNSTFDTGALLGATALVDSSVIIDGSADVASTLSMDGKSAISLTEANVIDVASIAAGATINAAGNDIVFGGDVIQIGSSTITLYVPIGDVIEYTGGSSNTVSAAIVAKNEQVQGSLPGNETYLNLTSDIGIVVDSAAAGATAEILTQARQVEGFSADSVVVSGDVSLSTALPAGSQPAWVDVSVRNASGSITLPGGAAGDLVSGHGQLQLTSKSVAGGPLVLGAGLDIIWRDLVSGSAQQTVIGAGANNSLDIGGKNTYVIEYVGDNVISVGGGIYGDGCVTYVTTERSARDAINVERGVASVNSGGSDSIAIESSVWGSDARVTGARSAVMLGTAVQHASVTLGGAEETINLAGTNNTVVGVDGANVTVGGSENYVLDKQDGFRRGGQSLQGGAVAGSSVLDIGRNDTVDASGIPAVLLNGSDGASTVKNANVVELNGTNNTLFASDVGTIVGAMSGGNVVAGEGVDLVDLRTRNGNVAVTVSGSASALVNGDNVDYRGVRGFIAVEGGNNVINIEPVKGAEGLPYVFANAGAMTVNAVGAAMIVGGGASLKCLGGSGDVTVTAGTGSVDFLGGTGRISVAGGSAGHNVLRAGDASGTLFGGGSGDLLVGGSSKSTLVAGAGSTTMVGGVGFTRMVLGTGADTVEMSTISGAVSEVAVGSGGSIQGPDVVLGWKNADVLQLTDGTKIVGEVVKSNLGTQVSLSNGATIWFSSFVGGISTVKM